MRQVEPHPDVLHEQLRRREVPCICPRQHDTIGPRGKPRRGTGQTARTVDYSRRDGRLREQVACNGCDKRWSRVNV